MELPSTQPYLIRAIHEWCCDNGLTPYLAVQVTDAVRVPREYVRDGQIVLNISPDATGRLALGNEDISFQARFGGVARDILVPVANVVAIYAKENGAGMAFEFDPSGTAAGSSVGAASPEDGRDPPPATPTGRPKLQRVK